jgi:hypothetical protein
MDFSLCILNRVLVLFASIPDTLATGAMTTVAFVFSGKNVLSYVSCLLRLVV